MKSYFLKIILLCLFFNGVQLPAQDTIPEQFLNDFPTYYNEFLKHDVQGDILESYAEQHAYSKFNLTFYHKIYYQQPLLEDYIRSILKLLLPDNSEVDKLNIFITKATDFNAFTISDGSIFVNIAALAQMTSEAELAFLLGHEYAHYRLKHGIHSYNKKYGAYKNKKKRRKRNVAIKELEEFNSFSQRNEISSDSLAMVMGTRAGYDYRAMDLLLQKLIFIQKKQVLRFNESYHAHLLFPTSHPIGEDRLLQLKLNAPPQNQGSLYILGEDLFNKVKRLAEYEFLKLLDEDFDLHEAISFPLKQYLLTGNSVYLPTLVRSIRKLMLIMPSQQDQGFLITHFQNYEERFGEKENILHYLNREYPDSNEIAKMKLKNVIDFQKVPFYSYEEAFDYFAKKSIDAGYEEPNLDLALHYGVKAPKGRRALRKYMSNPDNLYSEYASLLKKDDLMEDMEGRDKILLLGGISNYEYKKGNLKVFRLKDYNERNKLLAAVRQKYLEDSLHYKVYNYIDYYQQSSLGPHLRTIEKLVYSGKVGSLLRYDPRLYYALKKANVNSIEYMSILHLNHKNKGWRLLYLLYPPTTLSVALNLITKPELIASHVNLLGYYSCFLHNEKIYGKSYAELKTGRMTGEKAAKSLYNMHKEQKTFLRPWLFFNLKDRSEWRY